MNTTASVSVRALQIFEPDPEAVYPIQTAANLARTRRHRILVYCNQGLVSPATTPEQNGYAFNGEGIRALRQIERLRDDLGINLAGTRMILDLMAQVDRLRREVLFLRDTRFQKQSRQRP